MQRNFEPMRKQVEERTGQKVHEHLADGGYLTLDDIDHAEAQDLTLYVPPKPPRNKELRGSEYDPMPTDSDAVKRWRARMGSDDGKEIYKERAATSETINADFKTHRGLVQLTSDNRRPEAHRFYEALGFRATHRGYKLVL